MRGPGLHVSPEIRRQWRCPACGRERLVGQTETTVICRCQDPPRFMQLVEGKRVVRPEPRPVSRFIEEDEMPPDEIDPNAPPVDPNVESVSPPPPPRPPRPDRDKERPREQVRPREQGRPGEKGPPREQKRDRSGPPPHQKKLPHDRGEKRPAQTQPAEAVSVPLTDAPPPASPPSSDAAGPSKKKRRRNRDRNRSENPTAPQADGSPVAPEQQPPPALPSDDFGAGL